MYKNFANLWKISDELMISLQRTPLSELKLDLLTTSLITELQDLEKNYKILKNEVKYITEFDVDTIEYDE